MEITLLEKAIRGNKRSLRHLLKNESEFIYINNRRYYKISWDTSRK